MSEPRIEDLLRRIEQLEAAEAAMTNFYAEVAMGNIPGKSLIHKFGAGTLNTTLRPIASSGAYMTPTTAQSLEFVSSSANDASGGTGAQEVTVVGLDANWNEVTQTVITNGLTPVALSTPLTRLYRWYVSISGTYATATTGSHDGILTIRAAGAGATWSQIVITPFPLGQSQIGVYSIPIGYTAYLLTKNTFTDTSKTADFYFFQRPFINDVTTPYTGAMRLVEREVGVVGSFQLLNASPAGGIVGPADVGFMALVSVGTAQVSCEFELLMVQD